MATLSGDRAMANEDVPISVAQANDSRQGVLISVVIACLSLATVVSALRAYVRFYLLKKWGADDTALMASYLLVLCSGAIAAASASFGTGRHVWTIPPAELVIVSKVSLASVVVYNATLTVIKSTFLLQYRRVFPLPNFQRFCDAFLVFIVLFGISQTITAAVPCVPVSSLWDPTIPRACLNLVAWWRVNSIFNIVTDVIIMLMPLPLLRTLPLPWLSKAVLMLVFGLGIFTCAISIIRFTTLYPSSISMDVTYDTVPTFIWSLLEVSCAVFCICVPTLRPLLGFRTRAIEPMIAGFNPQITNSSGGDLEMGTTWSHKTKTPPVTRGGIREPPVAYIISNGAIVRKDLGRDRNVQDVVDEIDHDKTKSPTLVQLPPIRMPGQAFSQPEEDRIYTGDDLPTFHPMR